ncbi:two-component system sensor histidine kinase DesK [Catenuloplanes nepalensis]|uniref:Two-component system sensor histidine kinase DesK n=1 Tax=Catenuloplanes nepalensis TaxID=587533 RepID=A0ABT9MPR1_9ACTN|nr:histidine kinase [Catenuloplanes nepalensis]MDP9793392.1 two-component system sensor histidine kinase DesK [Catenuloplanes nepalensis]
MTFDRATATRGQLRTLNLITGLPPIVGTGALTLALDATSWWQVAILSTGLIAAVVAFERWTAQDLFRVAVPCLVVTVVLWPVGALWLDSPTSYFGLCIVGSHLVPRLPRFRRAAAIALPAYIGVVGALHPLLYGGEMPGTLVRYVLLPTAVTAVVAGFMFPNKRFYDVVEELEESREREAELAVARERVRFAGDLHDIQGHTLHVVKLKTALARKLVRTDPARAEEELQEIHALVSDTITQTKELVYAKRRLNLTVELENAKNLFEAAGIRVTVDGAGEGARPLLGQVLRETTTNILRHADATEVRITLTGSGITIVNDGARDAGARDAPAELRGLSALRQRVADDGGSLVAQQRDGLFTTAATWEEPR